MGPMPTFGGLKLPNAETYEQLYPIHVHRHEMRCDAAGPGEFRGGTGVHYEVDVQVPAEYTFRAEGTRKPVGVGAGGGNAGRKGYVKVTPQGGEPFTPPTYGVRNLGPARIVMESPAGGGCGDPLERDVAEVWCDIKGGLVSPRSALEDYGVVLLEDGSGADVVATEARRAAARAASGNNEDDRGR
jgi:N-methylhydantoinase B